LAESRQGRAHILVGAIIGLKCIGQPIADMRDDPFTPAPRQVPRGLPDSNKVTVDDCVIIRLG